MFENVRQFVGLKGFREAEGSDAGMSMKNRLSNRNKNTPNKQNNFAQTPSQNDEQGELISVQSALLFLEGFLEARLDRALQITDSAVRPQSNWLKFDAQNQNTSLATKAYQHASEISKKLRFSNRLPASNNSSEELKSIYMLIQDLRMLIDRDIYTLRLDQEDGFLAAVAKAISAEKQRLLS